MPASPGWVVVTPMAPEQSAGESPHEPKRPVCLTGIWRRSTTRHAGVWGLLAGCVLAALTVAAQATDIPLRTQSVPLRAGWNSVFLDVEPLDPAPSAVFARLPVTKVAAFLPPNSPVGQDTQNIAP